MRFISEFEPLPGVSGLISADFTFPKPAKSAADKPGSTGNCRDRAGGFLPGPVPDGAFAVRRDEDRAGRRAVPVDDEGRLGWPARCLAGGFGALAVALR